MSISQELLPEFDMEMVSKNTELNLVGSSPYTYEKTEDLLAMFDKNVKEAHVVRTHVNHLIHHRGQLTVYLRLIDVPLPAIYGPSADERAPGF